MKMRTALPLFLIPSAFVATSCAPSATGDSRAADASAIQALDEQWSATAARNDLAGTIGFYADDAVLLPPNAPIAKDQKAIRESWAGLLGANTAVSWKVSKVDVAKSGELGYLYGTYSLSIQDPKGGPQFVIPGSSSRSGRSKRMGGGSVLSILTTPICLPPQHSKRRSDARDCPKAE